MRRFIAAMFPVNVLLLGAGMAWGQDYPNKPVRIVTAAARGDGDFTTRIVAKAKWSKVIKEAGIKVD